MNPFQAFAADVFENELQGIAYQARRVKHYQERMARPRKKRKRSAASAFSQPGVMMKQPRRSFAYVNPVRSQELKFQDQQLDFLSTSAAVGNVQISSVNNIVSGIGPTQRTGRKIVVRGVQWRGHVILPNNVTNTSVRLRLGLDSQANGGTAQREETLNSSVGTTDPTTWFNNLMHVNRFKTFFDRVIDLNSSTVSSVTAGDPGQMQRKFSLYKKCEIPVEFDGLTGTISEIASNNLYVDALHQLVPLVQPSIISTVRIRFTDG